MVAFPDSSTQVESLALVDEHLWIHSVCVGYEREELVCDGVC